jgi:hypothetical protein
MRHLLHVFLCVAIATCAHAADLDVTLGLGPSTSVDTGNITTGQLAPARGGTGVDGSAAANGKLLIGNGTGYTLATLTAGNGVGVTNGAGSITLSPKSYLIACDASTHSVTGTLSETVLKTISVTAASYPIAANSVINVRSLWSFTNSANNKNLRIRIGAAGAGTGGTAMVSQGFTTAATYGRDCPIFVRSTSSEIAAAGVGGSNQFSSTAALTTAAIDLTANWEIAATGILGNTGETITLEAISVEVTTP